MASQRDRAALGNLFQQGAKPTGTDFADLIQSTLNFIDEGIAPGATSDDPLTIHARGTSEAFLELDIDGTNAWQLSHQPTADDSGLGFSYNGDCSLFIEAGTGNLGIGTTAPTAKLTVDGPVLSGDATASISLGHDGSNAAITANGPGRLQLSLGEAGPTLSLSAADVAVNGDLSVSGKSNVSGGLDVVGKITVGEQPPFVFERYTGLANTSTLNGYDTGYNTSAYSAAIVGFATRVGSSGGTEPMVYMAEVDGTWHLFADVSTASETWNVDVMFVRSELAERPDTWGKLS